MSERKELSFDGFGINGPGIYRERLATFTRHSHDFTEQDIKHYGKLFESAPELLKALRDIANAEDENSSMNAEWKAAHAKLCGFARATLKGLGYEIHS